MENMCFQAGYQAALDDIKQKSFSGQKIVSVPFVPQGSSLDQHQFPDNYAATDERSYSIRGTVIQKYKDGVLVVCHKTMLIAEGQIVYVLRAPKFDMIVEQSEIEIDSAIHSGTFKYKAADGTAKEIPQLIARDL